LNVRKKKLRKLKGLYKFAPLFTLLTTFDLGIKEYVEENYNKKTEKETVIPKVVLRKVHNRGFCLDTLDEYPAVVRGTSAVLSGIIGVQAYQLFQKRGRWMEKLGTTILGAGAFSNTFDRIVRGYVVDYFGVEAKNSKLSKITANLADLYILVGSLVLFAAKEKGVKRNGNTDKK